MNQAFDALINFFFSGKPCLPLPQEEDGTRRQTIEGLLNDLDGLQHFEHPKPGSERNNRHLGCRSHRTPTRHTPNRARLGANPAPRRSLWLQGP